MGQFIADDEIIVYRQILDNYLKQKHLDANFSEEEKESLAERALSIMRRDEIILFTDVIHVLDFLLKKGRDS